MPQSASISSNFITKKRLARASIRQSLSCDGVDKGFIWMDGKDIGSYVSYAKNRGGNVAPLRKAFASRILRHGVCIEVEAGSPRVLLDKVAAEIEAAIVEGKWLD